MFFYYIFTGVSNTVLTFIDDSKIILPEEFSPIPEESFYVLSETGTIDWEASFKRSVESLNSRQLINGSRIVLSEQQQDKLNKTIASQSVEMVELKETVKRTCGNNAPDVPGTSVSVEHRKKRRTEKPPKQPHYPIVFDKKADDNATEPVVSSKLF